MEKNIYFLSDAHLGSLAIPHARTQERRLVRFLDSIKEKASAIYLLGDMFDFWDEYRYALFGQVERTDRRWSRSALFYGQP